MDVEVVEVGVVGDDEVLGCRYEYILGVMCCCFMIGWIWFYFGVFGGVFFVRELRDVVLF